jgi:FkbM family methyltransferase
MLDIYEFRRAGRSKKITSWITDPLRFLACSFLWPYFNRLLKEIDKQSQLNAVAELQRELNSRGAELQRELNSRGAELQRELNARVAELQRELNARVAELQRQLNSQGAELQRQLESRVNVVKEIEELVAKHAHLGARVESVQKDAIATAMRLASLESLFISYREKNLQLEDGGKISIDGTSLVLAASKYGRFLLRCPDLISETILAGRYWDPHLQGIIERTGRQELAAIDAGSYFGFHAIHMARHFGQVYAFEPQTTMFEMLCANILLNQMQNIKAFNNALFDHECFMQLAPVLNQEIPVPFVEGRVDYDRVGNAAALAFGLAGERAQGAIHTLTIDSLNLDNVGLIKIDTQGSDFHVIKGAASTVTRCRPVVIFEYEQELSRLHGEKFEDFEQFFESVGYDVKLLAVQSEGKQTDYVATPREA